MTLTRSFIRNAPMTPLDARLILMGQVTTDYNLTPRAGVLGTSSSIVATTASMAVTIAAAEFATTKGRADGVAIFANDGPVTVPIATAPTTNSRIDVIYVKHNDSTTGDVDSIPFFGVATGTVAASPVKPSIPTGALELATLQVYAGTTATNGGTNTLTNTYQFAALRGAPVRFRNKLELDQWTTALAGQEAVTINDGWEYKKISDAWVATWAPPRVGTVSPDGNATMSWSRATKDQYGMVDIAGQANRTNGTTYAVNLIMGVVPAAFRPVNDAPAIALTYGSGTLLGATVAPATGLLALTLASPAGHTVARFQARYQGTP